MSLAPFTLGHFMHLECYVLANPEKEQGIVDDPLFTHKTIVAEISAEKISLINIVY